MVHHMPLTDLDKQLRTAIASGQPTPVAHLWRLMGVACGPREAADPKVNSPDEWCAWARGPNKERLEGRGSGPHDALLELTVKLKELTGWFFRAPTATDPQIRSRLRTSPDALPPPHG